VGQEKDEFYGYDGLNRLTQYNRGSLSGGVIADAAANFNQQWTSLEALGNWRKFKAAPTGGASYTFDQDRAHNSANEIDTDNDDSNAAGNSLAGIGGADWIDPVQDKAGNMKSGPKPAAETTRLHYTYDAWNRMVQVNNDSGGVPGTLLLTCSYDGLNRRLTKAVSGGTTFHYYYNENWQVLEIRHNVETAARQHFIWDGRYIDAVVARYRATTTPGSFNESLYFTQDANLNTTAIVNTSRVVQERYTYDAYGKPNFWTASWGTKASSTFANENLFAGYRQDAETAICHVRNRFYHPTLGRWVQRDPLEYHDGANLIEYVSSRPLDFLDPSGLTGDDFPGFTEWLKEKVRRTGKWPTYDDYLGEKRHWESLLKESDRLSSVNELKKHFKLIPGGKEPAPQPPPPTSPPSNPTPTDVAKAVVTGAATKKAVEVVAGTVTEGVTSGGTIGAGTAGGLGAVIVLTLTMKGSGDGTPPSSYTCEYEVQCKCPGKPKCPYTGSYTDKLVRSCKELLPPGYSYGTDSAKCRRICDPGEDWFGLGLAYRATCTVIKRTASYP
jgi:RHS repeat-associated protein